VKDLKSDRDPSMERLLRRHLKADDAIASTDACLTAETLAAWADGALTARERADVETHAADCVRCQALLAAMAKTAPVGDARPWWRRPLVGWLAPAAAVGIALVLWAIVPNRRTFDVSQRPATVTSVAASSNSAPAPSPAVAPQPAAQVPIELEARRAPKPAVARDRRVDAKRDESFALEKREAAAARPEAVEERVAAPAAAAAAPPATGAGAAAQARETMADRSTARSQMFAAKAAPSLGFVVMSPDPASRWRVSNGSVQRSTDAGSTWQPQTIEFSATLTAGAAPSPRVCWLVGRNGVVLLSIDGQSWHPVRSIAGADLVSVQAIDDKTATVTASDGRTFTTKDAGVTWARP